MVKTKRACVVIPVYQDQYSAYELISMQQCFSVLSNYDIFFVIPKKLENFICSNTYYQQGRAFYQKFDDSFFVDIPAYNRLMKNPDFYAAFINYEYMLIYQLDAFVFKDELMLWCDKGYSNMGAPLFEGHEQATADSLIVGQGNGGFCLRRVKDCYKVVTTWKKLKFIKQYTDSKRSVLRNAIRYIKHQLIYIYSRYPFQPIINEDLFWAVEIPAVFPDFKLPDPLQSVAFSFEVNPRVLYKMNHEELPFGCHAWWRYDLDFWVQHIQSFGYELS